MLAASTASVIVGHQAPRLSQAGQPGSRATGSRAPTGTGNATAIALIYPELKGKPNGHAVRAPVLVATLTDCRRQRCSPATASTPPSPPPAGA
jgi:glyceraldehyde-3-phosphate dehydrogenase/erythrose-4-phosphate dehydrogenase